MKTGRLTLILVAIITALALIILVATAVRAQGPTGSNLGPLPTPFVGGPLPTRVPQIIVASRDVPEEIAKSSDNWTLWLGLTAVVIVLVIYKFRRW